MLLLKASRSVIRFLWVKGLSTNAIHFDMRPVYGDKYFTTHDTSNTCLV